jgi:SnoaL-like domain
LTVGGLKTLFEEQFARLYNTADGSGLAALWVETGSYSSTIPGKPMVTGRSAIATMWLATFTPNRPWPKVSVAVRSARVIAQRAEVQGLMTYSNDSASSKPTSDFTAVLVSERGTWRLSSMRVGLLRGVRID